ncbi:MAG: glycogen synthase [Chromatiaceae bacterium]|nr:glycogen synthase [Chromatiaceae bacterium]
MYIVMASAECAPVAKAGGLGDFVHGLARELVQAGHRVEVLLPKYDSLRLEAIVGLEKAYPDLWVPFYDQGVACDLYQGQVDGIDCWFIDPHSPQDFFNRGVIHGEPDDPDRFAYYARALMEFLHQSGRHPDVIHCNDWHTGLIPVLLYETYQALGLNRTRVCYTLHNLGHQGWVGEYILHQLGLDARRLMTLDRLRDPGNPHTVNPMKGGIVYANYVTTVSPRYAWEIQSTEQGMGLQETLRRHGHKFSGILNGIDYDSWNPLTDRHLPHAYGPESLPDKARNKQALRQRLGLAEAAKPLIAVVSRLDAQKGVELIRHAILHGLERGAQTVLLGSAQDPILDAYFRVLQGEMAANPDCYLELGYDEELAHLIYAAADIMVIPSVYEPCGLTQMIAMRYGVVPVVRRVGGLADTVFDANYSDKPFAERNGYVFDDLTTEALESALDRALGLWFDYPEYFRQLRLNGMAMDNSWARPARQYLDIFEEIRVQPPDIP